MQRMYNMNESYTRMSKNKSCVSQHSIPHTSCTSQTVTKYNQTSQSVFHYAAKYITYVDGFWHSSKYPHFLGSTQKFCIQETANIKQVTREVIDAKIGFKFASDLH